MDVLPLTHYQLGLWIEAQLAPQSTDYNACCHFRVQGRLDTKLIEKALNILTDEYQALRTCFRVSNALPKQVIAECANIDFNFVDLSNALDAERRERTLHTNLKAFEHTIFDLTTLPLSKYMVNKLDENTNVISFIWHHIIMDGISIKIFLDRLAFLYSSLINNKINYERLDLVSMPELLASANTWDQGKQYWKKRLESADFTCTQTLDQQVARHENNQNNEGTRLELRLSRQLTHGLENLLEETRTSLFIILMAAINTILFRYTGKSDLIVGYVANVRNKLSRNLMGNFVNNLVLRTLISNDMTFMELILLIRENRKNDRQYQDVPYPEILQQVRENSDQPVESLYSIGVAQYLSKSYDLYLEGCSLQSVPVSYFTTKSDLIFYFDLIDVVCIDIEFNKTIYSEHWATELLDSLTHVLQQACDAPHTKLTEFSLMSEATKEKVLYTWNNTKSVQDINLSLHGIVAAQTLNIADRVAIVDTKAFTFGDLENASNKIANFLRNKKANIDECFERNKIMAICIEPCFLLVSGMLGILKSNDAFMLLEPEHPDNRLAFMIADSGCEYVITSEKHEERLKQLVGTKCKILIFKDILNHGRSKKNTKHASCQTNNLAYVIYTSGTTGSPKAVMVEHKSIVNYLLWLKNTYPLNQEDRLLHKTSVSFDPSISDFFFPLICGAKLVIEESGENKDPFYLINSIKKHDITAIHFVPTFLDKFINVAIRQDYINYLISLRYIFVGGEQLERELLNKVSNVTDAVLVNLYGPTETTISVTHWHSTLRNYNQPSTSVPIGGPISGVCCYVLDRFLKLVPPGVVGELYVSGIALARGYLNDEELTEEKFIPNFLITDDSNHNKMYKTGDYVRWNENGLLEYIGRMDDQVKVRGVRIELNEINSAITSQPSVTQCVTILEEMRNRKVIISFIVAKDTANQLDIATLRNYLLSVLPNYVMPDYIHVVPEIPVKVNGKLDRSRLLTMVKHEQSLQATPRTHQELNVLSVFKKTLNRSDIKLTDNFFYLGGNSLLAIETVSILRIELMQNISVSDLLRNPTVETLASIIQLKSTGNNTSLIQFQKGISSNKLYCIHPAGGTAFCYLPLAEAISSDHSVYGIQSPGVDRDGFSVDCLSNLASQYIDLIDHHDKSQKITLVGWSLGGVIAFEMACELAKRHCQIEALILLDPLPPNATNKAKACEINREEFIKKLVRFNGLYPGIDNNQIDRYHHIYNSHTMAFKQYEPHQYSGKVLLIGAKSTDADLLKSEWSVFIKGNLVVEAIEADHWSFMQESNPKAIAKIIEKNIGNQTWNVRTLQDDMVY